MMVGEIGLDVGESGLMRIDKSTWSPTVSELVENGKIFIGPFEMVLEYDYWSYGMFHTYML